MVIKSPRPPLYGLIAATLMSTKSVPRWLLAVGLTTQLLL